MKTEGRAHGNTQPVSEPARLPEGTRSEGEAFAGMTSDSVSGTEPPRLQREHLWRCHRVPREILHTVHEQERVRSDPLAICVCHKAVGSSLCLEQDLD